MSTAFSPRNILPVGDRSANPPACEDCHCCTASELFRVCSRLCDSQAILVGMPANSEITIKGKRQVSSSNLSMPFAIMVRINQIPGSTTGKCGRWIVPLAERSGAALGSPAWLPGDHLFVSVPDPVPDPPRRVSPGGERTLESRPTHASTVPWGATPDTN